MPSSTQNVKVGVCTVDFGGTNLGFTKGGVSVSVTTETYSVTVDQFGDTAISEIITGRTVTVSTPLAETTLENLVQVMPGATLIGTGASKKVEVVDAVSTDLLSISDKLTLHPQALAETDKSEDFVIPYASTPGQIEFAYELNSERVFNCEWKGYPDPTTRVLFIFGDETATA